MGQSGRDAYRVLNSLSPLPPYRSKPLQDNDPRFVEFYDKLYAPVNICGFDASLYTSVDIWLTFVYKNDVQRPLRDVDAAYSEQLKAFLCNHSFGYCPRLISIARSRNWNALQMFKLVVS